MPLDLQHGRQLGLACALRPLRETCQAAMLRTHAWEGSGEGGIPWATMRRALARDQADTENQVLKVMWAGWFDAHHPTVILGAVAEAAAHGITMAAARLQIAGCGPLTLDAARSLRKKTQAWFVGNLLRRHHFDPVSRLRKRTARCRLPGPPGRTSATIHRNLMLLRRQAPSRVRAAVLGTLLNRWTTTRRMRGIVVNRRSCLLGCCRDAEDSIEHLLACPVTKEWVCRRLQLASTQVWRSRWLLGESMPLDVLLRIAVAQYALYRTTNHLRHRNTTHSTPDYIQHYLNQILHEATRDSPQLRDYCRGAQPWSRKRRRTE